LVVAGRKDWKNFDFGDMRLSGTLLFAKAERVHGPFEQLVDRGSKMATGKPLKSPPRAAIVGKDTRVGRVSLLFR
jgi:hypothetical protein